MPPVSHAEAEAFAVAYAREFKDAALELRRAALALLKVADRFPRHPGIGFRVVIPCSPANEARLRELAELSCRICFKETLDASE